MSNAALTYCTCRKRRFILAYVISQRLVNGQRCPSRAAEPGSGQLTSVNAWRQNMRIRRNILAPAILTVGTIGSLVAGPVLALTTAAAPATAAVAISATPNTPIMHG